MDDPSHWEIHRLSKPNIVELQETMVLWSSLCCFRFQHVSTGHKNMMADVRGNRLIPSFIVLGSTNEMARKILNSPNHAEPCLVYSAAKVLLKENWVFLHGKAHADYRKALNVLFTKKALS